MQKEELIEQILLLPIPALEYHLGKHLRDLFPQKAILETVPSPLDVEGFAEAGRCTLTFSPWSYNEVQAYWQSPESDMLLWHPARLMRRGFQHRHMPAMQNFTVMQIQPQQQVIDRLKKAWVSIIWEGKTLDALILHVNTEDSFPQHNWIIADDEQTARDFLAAVSEWSEEIRSEVLVFDGGQWHKDGKLFLNIQGTDFDNLILKGNLKEEVLNDLQQFFASRDVYEEHDIPWKRGILLLGPAGNGKTHTVKALINTLDKPCLYVKSFRAPYSQDVDEVNIRQVFDRARRTAPCILVLEDLDALITSRNRSFFLNELDGFAANIGIVTLATTNHPERLDPAILNRPSRFDRKYYFNLPDQPERLAYIGMWNTALADKLRLSDEDQREISVLSADFSFAYLKELFLSSKMRWIAQNQQRPMAEVMMEQIQVLREQMTSVQSAIGAEPSDEDL